MPTSGYQNTMSKNIRDLHVGKTPAERDEYRKLLDEDYVFDRIIEEPLNTDKTNTSSYENDKKLTTEKVKKKSLFLKIRDGDILKNIYVSGIIIGLTVLIIWAFFNNAIDTEINKSKIKDLEKNYTELQGRTDSLDKNFSVFKEGASKELGYIKTFLKL